MWTILPVSAQEIVFYMIKALIIELKTTLNLSVIAPILTTHYTHLHK